MSGWLAAVLVLVNLGLIFFLMAAPIGRRTVSRSIVVDAGRERLWQALWPGGEHARWSGEIVDVRPDGEGRFHIALSWEGRDGRPIERVAVYDDVVPGRGFTMRIAEDSSLDPSFWSRFSETVELDDTPAGTRVAIRETDHYRGFAFLGFRFFALRRRLGKLKVWAETGMYRPGGAFEHPLTQFAFAALSVLILWSFTGFTVGGLAFAIMLTVVVALHELGHMIAFRISGHRRVRMIFVPLLGGIAVGGRPYNSHFEVAFVALMGAGFSAFLVPPLLFAGDAVTASGNMHGSNFIGALVGCIALFNMANMVPVWKFDGGQVLRQIIPGGIALAVGSFVLLAVFLAIAWLAGFPERIVLLAGVVLAALSLITSGSAVKPRHALVPIDRAGRVMIALGLTAVIAIHGAGVVWAFDRFF